MLIRKFIVSLSLAIFLTLPAYNQSSVDSLKLKTDRTFPDNEAKARAYKLLADSYLNRDPDSAKYYSKNGLILSEKIKFITGIFENSCTLGKVYLRKDSIDKAIEIFEKARMNLGLLEDKRDALCVMLLLGYAYDIKDDFYRAHETYYTGLEIDEDTRDSAMLWSFFNNLGTHS